MGALAGPITNILRMLFVAIIQSAAIATIATYLDQFVDYVRNALRKDGGLTEEQTDEAMYEWVLIALSGTAITVASLKSRLPIRLADRLGLKLQTAGRKETSTGTKLGVEKALKGSLLTQSAMLKVLKTLGLSFVASLPWLPGLIQQFGDQASFAPKAANDFYQKFFGVRPFTEASPLDSPGKFTPAEFQDYARSLEAAGIKGIEYGFPKGTVLYSRTALAELIDYVTGIENANARPTTVAKITPLLAKYLIGITGTPSPIGTSSSVGGSATAKPSGASTPAAASLPAAGAGASTYAPVKVFTGILSSGTLGAAQPFNSKEDDLINSALELRDIAQTNAAAFLATLPSKVVYELKIVNSVIASDGTKRVGATVQVPNGRLASGAIKYKYVNNKFAVMTLYLIKKDGTRTKITDITLGPTDVANFNPNAEQLAGIGNNLVQSVATNSTDDIAKVITDTPTEVVPTSTALAPLPNYNFAVKQPGDLGYAFYMRPAFEQNQASYLAVPDYKFYDTSYQRITEEQYRRGTGDTRDYTNSGYYLNNGVFTQATTYRPSHLEATSAPPTTTTTATAAGVAAKATNLSQYYAALGQTIPSLSARGQTYQSLGLGAASLYTGTIEQNTKLLAALQGK